jgi:hypothetical protein
VPRRRETVREVRAEHAESDLHRPRSDWPSPFVPEVRRLGTASEQADTLVMFSDKLEALAYTKEHTNG